MQPSKPLTENIKEKANSLYLFLEVKNDYVTKEEIGKYLGIKNERTVRDVISVLATKKPILSNSANKGYKLAQTIEDLEDLEHTWAELSSRMEEIKKRIKPLIDFRDKIKIQRMYLPCYDCAMHYDCERTYLGGCTDGKKWEEQNED